MIKTDKVIVVEGKYDAIKLASIVDAPIITTEGFGIFKDSEKQALLRRLASERGLVILTDSDSAGFMIRNFIGNCVPASQITNVYIPDVYGKEKRKATPSAEGKLGVEGVPVSVLLDAFHRAGVDCATPVSRPQVVVTRQDFYSDGLMGGKDSKALRAKLLRMLDLPARMSTSTLLSVINILISYDEYKEVVKSL